MEPETKNAILQPVLQWGATNVNGVIGSWSNWTYAAWYGDTGGNYFHSPGIAVGAGDTLDAYITVTSIQGGLTWVVRGSDRNSPGLGVQSVYSVFTGLSWTYAFAAALEAYQINTCSDLPAGSSGSNRWNFPNLRDQNGVVQSANWSPCYYNSNPACATAPLYTGPSCSFGISQSSQIYLSY